MTREEAIKYAEAMKAKVQERIEFFRLGHTHAPEVHYSDLAFLSAAISALREQEERRWIPVTERLPECGKRVLATDGGFVGEFYINKRGQWQRYNVNDSSLLMALDILFWMPLPEPPKEGV